MVARDAVPSATVVLPTEDPTAASPSTLRELVDTLGPHALRIVRASDALLDRPVGEPVVHGVGEPVEGVEECLVLLTGGRPGRVAVNEAVRSAGGAGAHALVLKAWDEDLDEVARVASEAGVALLSTPDEMAWRHLDALVTAARSAVARVGSSGAPPQPSGDLFSLANAIAASIGGAVTLEEPTGRVIAYSNLPGQEIDEIRRLAILGRQTPDRPTNSEEYGAIMQAPGPVFFESSRPDYASRMATAVRAGHQVVGIIFVLCDRPPVVDGARALLVDAARAAALHLLRARGHQDPDRVRRSEVLRGVATGEVSAVAAAPVLGPAMTDGAVLAVVRPLLPLQAREVETVRLTDLVTLHGEYWHTGTVSAVLSDQILLLLPVEESAEGAGGTRGAASLEVRLRELGTDMVTAVRRSMQVDVRIGFAPPVAGLDQLATSLSYAERILEVLASSGANRRSVATLDDVRNDVVLSALCVDPTVVDPAFVLPQVRAVIDHDAANGTDYARTLLTYLGAFGDMAMTAKQLSVHENTARYRVRRLSDMFGIDLGAGDETLVVWLQLRALADRVRGTG